MKRIIFSIFFLFNALICFNQEFAPVGANWYYTQYSSIYPQLITYETFESVIDTVYEGYNAKKILQISRGGMNIEEVRTTKYMFKRNDSVFYYNQDLSRYCLLYDFSAKQKDTIKLDCYEAYYDQGVSSLKVIIDSVKVITINGISKKVQYVKSGDGLVIEFGGVNIEDIGNVNYMFPTFDNNYSGPLRCYTNNDFIYKNPFYNNQIDKWNGDCNQIVTGITSFTQENSNIYPNPISNYLMFPDLQGLHRYKLFDLQGNELKCGTVDQYQSINVSDLQNAMYILILNYGNLSKHLKIIKK